jgi:hypothetical protein
MAVVLVAATLAAVPIASAAQPMSSSGGCEYISNAGNDVQFGFTAIKRPDESAQGQGNISDKEHGFKVHFQVLDLLVMDNTCWFLGEITHGESGDFVDVFLGAEDLTGFRFIQSGQDNGEGAAADPDRVGGNAYWEFPYFPYNGSACTFVEIDPACVDSIINLPFGFGILFSPIANLTEGNIQVQN